jgi:plasmid stabilization system protein ParE
MKVTWTEQAWERLLEIEHFFARDDPRSAARLVDKLIDRGDAHPGRRPHFAPTRRIRIP